MYERFYEFGLSDEVLSALGDMGFEEPTQIQKIAIPPVMKGKDIIGVAQTGTGKTAAFGIPIIEKNVRGRAKHPGALVMAPTRELAMQVAAELNRLGRNKGMVAAPIYGGQSMERQIKSLKKGVDMVVGTPGRIMDHMRRKTLVLSEVATVVLDEADEMLNMGFVEDMNTILAETPKGRQTLLFSATMPEQIVRISKKYMTEPKRVSVDAKELVAAKINQVFYEVRDIDKPKALTRIIDVQDPALTLIFCHTKREVDDLASKLQQMGYEAGAIHGDFTQAQRDEMMRLFKRGEIDILVATDVAARGLDISDVSHVINYSIPQNPDAYVHRIGRTGRAGRSGIAITFVTPREYSQLRLIERTAKTRISKGKLPTPKEVREAREHGLVEELEEVLAEGSYKSMHSIVADLAMKHDLADVAAAALSLIAGDLEVEDIQELSGPRPVERGEMTRLFLTIGKKDKVKVGDMVRAIAQGSNIPGRTIGKIVLFDNHSFVEVPESIAQQVIGSVQELMIGGRKVQVKKAFPREDRKGGKGSGKKKEWKKDDKKGKRGR